MLSKCLNSRCSATFKYLGSGRLFRISFTEESRRFAMAGKKLVASIRSKAQPIEHFWLCERCATAMTIELSDAGEVRLVPFEVPAQKPTAVAAAPQTQTQRSATAS
jgi:hypothetical protein